MKETHSFLEGTTGKTDKVWAKAHDLIVEEIKKGIIDVEVNTISGIENFKPGYIDKDNEVIVGLQTDAPLKKNCKSLWWNENGNFCP